MEDVSEPELLTSNAQNTVNVENKKNSVTPSSNTSTTPMKSSGTTPTPGIGVTSVNIKSESKSQSPQPNSQNTMQQPAISNPQQSSAIHQLQQISTNNQNNQAQQELPKDAKLMISILESMGVTDYEPQVVNQLLDFVNCKSPRFFSFFFFFFLT